MMHELVPGCWVNTSYVVTVRIVPTGGVVEIGANTLGCSAEQARVLLDVMAKEKPQ